MREQGPSPRAVPDSALPLGLLLGLASILVYITTGYGTSMLALWVASFVTLTVYFWSRSAPAPRFPRREVVVPPALMLAFAPLYLALVHRWPVQVSSDETAIMDVARQYAVQPNVDPFGLSTYLARPALLFLAWGDLGELIGGIDLFHMRLLHGAFGLLTIGASYLLFRQLLPRGWAVFAAGVLGLSHAFFMISRLAMRENTAVLVEVIALALLLWGLRNDHMLSTFLGGFVAGLCFYVYFPARATFPVWVLFLILLGVLFRSEFPVRRIVRAGLIGTAGFLLMASPIVIAESKAPDTAGSLPQKETLLIYPEARELQRTWVFESKRCGRDSEEHLLGPDGLQQQDRGPRVHLQEQRARLRRPADRDLPLGRGALRRHPAAPAPRGSRARSSRSPGSSCSGSRSPS